MATLLTIEKLRKAYGPRAIFTDATLAVHEKQKIGVIGRNGAGKSTLLRIVVGQEEYDGGTLVLHDICRLGYLEQHDNITSETVISFLLRTTQKESWQCAKVAGKFELKGSLLEAPLSSLSGGFYMRVKLASMLLKEPNLFLLDEPTNYLDVHTQLLLEQFLQGYRGAFLIISHDREFLKRTCEETLDVENGELFLYPSPIDNYLEYKEERLAFAEHYNKKVEREEKHLQKFVDRFRYKASKAKQAQSKLKAIERLKKIDVKSPLATVRISIPGVVAKNGLLLRVNDLAIGYGENAVAKNIHLDIDRGEHVAILGDNGQGKTTFLKTISGALPVLSGTFKWAHDAKIAYYAQHVPGELDPLESVWHYLRRIAPPDINDEEVLKMAGNFLFREDELEKNSTILSGGEKARLCLAGVLLSKSNVLLLDEPTNHLDFETVEALGRALEDFVGTVFFISHNRTFVNSVATMILEVGGGSIRRYAHSYEDYIYHLQQSVVEVQAEPAKVIPTQTVSVATKQERYEALKSLKKKLKEIEEAILYFEKEKNRLAKKQAKDPAKFSLEDYTQLGQAMREVEKKEGEWIALQERIVADEV